MWEVIWVWEWWIGWERESQMRDAREMQLVCIFWCVEVAAAQRHWQRQKRDWEVWACRTGIRLSSRGSSQNRRVSSRRKEGKGREREKSESPSVSGSFYKMRPRMASRSGIFLPAEWGQRTAGRKERKDTNGTRYKVHRVRLGEVRYMVPLHCLLSLSLSLSLPWKPVCYFVSLCSLGCRTYVLSGAREKTLQPWAAVLQFTELSIQCSVFALVYSFIR